MLCSENLTRRIEVRTDDIRRQMLDEAFFGREPVYTIQRAMDRLYQYYMANNYPQLNYTKYSKDLEDAIQKVFGFGKVDIVWTQVDKRVGAGPCTIPNIKLFHLKNASFRKPKKTQNGFYDTTHELHAVIILTATLFDVGGVTPEEMTALLLHELGHNFDYTPYAIIDELYGLVDTLIFDVVPIIEKSKYDLHKKGELIGTVIGMILGTAFKEKGTGIFLRALGAKADMITDLIPSMRPFVIQMSGLLGMVKKAINVVKTPIIFITKIPNDLMFYPTRYVSNTFSRKTEQYADSFAAAYGYGNELINGLEKMTTYNQNIEEKMYNLPVLQIFEDLYIFKQEILSVAYGEHTSHQQRLIKIRAKLEQDLNDKTIPSKLKVQIKKDLDRINRTNDKMLGYDADSRVTITTIFRRVMDDLYGKKDYIVAPGLGNNFV